MMAWHKQIRERLRSESTLKITGSGSLWGLACNGIHYLDLVSWWTDEKLRKIDTSKLDSKWIESKRKGFFEVTGKITAVYSGGTCLVLESRQEGSPFKMKVKGENKIWEIDETKGVASGPDDFLILGKNEMQSSMTSKLVDDILAGKNCELPKLSDSVEMHRIFLRSLLEHWNNVNSRNDETLPIT
jgi:trehalose utilization protein